MKISEFVESNTIEQFVKYAEQFDGMFFENEKEVKSVHNKLQKMLQAYGFKLDRPFSWKVDNTSWFWKVDVPAPEGLDGDWYWLVQTGWIWNYKTTRKASTRLNSNKGLFRADLNKKSKPLPYGYIDRSNPNYERIWTKMGWWTGD